MTKQEAFDLGVVRCRECRWCKHYPDGVTGCCEVSQDPCQTDVVLDEAECTLGETHPEKQEYE